MIVSSSSNSSIFSETAIAPLVHLGVKEGLVVLKGTSVTPGITIKQKQKYYPLYLIQCLQLYTTHLLSQLNQLHLHDLCRVI